MRSRLPRAGLRSSEALILFCAVVMLLGSASGAALAQGNSKAGRLKADSCLGCHGIPGYMSVYPSYPVPKVGGQHAQYIVSALKAYKSGQRDNPTMEAQANTLSNQDMADIAAFFESYPQNAGAAKKGQPAKKGQ
jgi:cytochrome c553